ncbi:hypothetical protein CPB85DRAFT_1296994 [Mucidula mucida]|nr:hypothetical protein CPB85DRAFT_1296994 [Mucidula mucida]
MAQKSYRQYCIPHQRGEARTNHKPRIFTSSGANIKPPSNEMLNSSSIGLTRNIVGIPYEHPRMREWSISRPSFESGIRSRSSGRKFCFLPLWRRLGQERMRSLRKSHATYRRFGMFVVWMYRRCHINGQPRGATRQPPCCSSLGASTRQIGQWQRMGRRLYRPGSTLFPIPWMAKRILAMGGTQMRRQCKEQAGIAPMRAI